MPETVAGRWWYALKPASWPKLLVPAAIGQVAAVAEGGVPSIPGALLGALFVVLDVAFIVLVNDYGDREVDAIKRRMFPSGCSPKTIPDGILPAHHVLVGGLVAGALALLVAGIGAVWLGRPLIVPLAAGCLAVFVAYSLPPLRLNYRGGGELLEMFGCGVALPCFEAYVQCGRLLPAVLAWMLPGFASLALASAVASGLSDEVSDRAGGKRTFTTLLGNPIARRVVLGLVLGGALAWLGAALWAGSLGAVAGAAVVLVRARSLERAGRAAVTNAFAAQARFKDVLHRAIADGALTFAVLALIERAW